MFEWSWQRVSNAGDPSDSARSSIKLSIAVNAVKCSKAIVETGNRRVTVGQQPDTARTITLITGDRVTLTATAGAPRVHVESARTTSPRCAAPRQTRAPRSDADGRHSDLTIVRAYHVGR